MKPCKIENTGKHYSFYVKREVEGGGCEKSFSWNGTRWLSEAFLETTEYNTWLGMITKKRVIIKTHRIPNRSNYTNIKSKTAYAKSPIQSALTE